MSNSTHSVAARKVESAEPAMAAARPSLRVPSLARIAANLEAMMEASRKFGDAALDVRDAQLALNSLLLGCHGALDALAAIGGKANLEDVADAEAALRMNVLRDSLLAVMPPISGGAPDDFEECDAAIFDASWPEFTALGRDGHTYEVGPTPLDVLARDDFDADRTDADWDSYAALSMGLSEADHMAAVGSW